MKAEWDDTHLLGDTTQIKYVVLAGYQVLGMYRQLSAAKRLKRESEVVNYGWQELEPRIVSGISIGDFRRQCHDLELWRIACWFGRAGSPWGRSTYH